MTSLEECVEIKTPILSDNIALASTPVGIGVFARTAFETGDTLIQFRHHYGSSPTRYTIQIDAERHLTTEDTPGAFLNHSCAPNTSFLPETLELIAIMPISLGDELTFNYLTTELEMAAPFDCACGADECFGHISGFANLTRSGQMHLRDQCAPYLRAYANQILTLV